MEMDFSGKFYFFYQGFDKLWFDEGLTLISGFSLQFTADLASPLARAALSSRQHLAPNFLFSNNIFPMEPREGSVALLVSEAAPFITIP